MKESYIQSSVMLSNDSNAFLFLEQMWPPVVARINFCQIVCSNGSSNSPILGMVRMKYVNLLLKPLAYAAYADFGSVSAVLNKSCCWLFKLVTSSLKYFSFYFRCRKTFDVKLNLVFPKTTFSASKYWRLLRGTILMFLDNNRKVKQMN